jgi:hypothetical protein
VGVFAAEQCFAGASIAIQSQHSDLSPLKSGGMVARNFRLAAISR